MPQIKTYEAPDLGLRPSETGIAAVAGAARRVQGDYNEIAAAREATGHRFSSDIQIAGKVATDYIAHQEVSSGALNLANTMRTKTAELDKAFRDNPDDPNVGQKFLKDNLEPDLEKFKGAFFTEKGQQWAESHVDQFRQHMFTKVAADESTLAGQRAVVQHKQTVNSLSNMVMSDPSSRDFAIQTLNSTVDAVVDTSGVKGALAGKLRSEMTQKGTEAIIKAAAQAEIQKTGEVPAWTSDAKYSPYIDGAELKTFQQYAKAQQTRMRLEDKQARLYDRQLQADESHTALSKTWTDNVSFDQNGKATINPAYFKKIMDIEQKYPGVSTERAKTMINWAQQQQRERREVIIDDPMIKAKLLDGMFDADNPTTDVDILSAAASDKLSPHTTSTYLQLYKALEQTPLKGPIYHDTMGGVKAILGSGDKGTENYAKFVQTFIPEYIKQTRAGTLPPNALDLKDPTSLISKSLDPWKLTPQEKMMDRVMKNMGGEIPGGMVPGATPTPGAAPPKARIIGGQQVPAALGGIAALQYNPARKLWRDETSGAVYDSAGQPVKQ